MRTRLNHELVQLHDEIIQMGLLCEEALAQSLATLFEGQKDGEAVHKLEEQIDLKEVSIHTLCNRLLLLEQPIAADLRTVSSAIKLIADLERVGDQASDIAELAVHLPEGPLSRITLHIMAESAQAMVCDCVNAFIRQDTVLAGKIIAADEGVDGAFTAIREELVHMLIHHPEQAAPALDTMMIAKYLERIADHAVNVAEWVCYAHSGEHPPHL